MVCQSLKKPHDECMLLDVLSKTAAEVTLFALALQPQETKEMAPEAKVWSEPEGTIEAFFFLFMTKFFFLPVKSTDLFWERGKLYLCHWSYLLSLHYITYYNLYTIKYVKY